MPDMTNIDRTLQSALWRCDIRVACKDKWYPLGPTVKEEAQAERRTQDGREAKRKAYASAACFDASRPCWVRMVWRMQDCWRWMMTPMQEGC